MSLLWPFSPNQCCVLLCFILPYCKLTLYVSNGMGALLSTAEETKKVSGNGCVYKIYNKSEMSE